MRGVRLEKKFREAVHEEGVVVEEAGHAGVDLMNRSRVFPIFPEN
jgi:hypothetical protein